MNGWVKNGEAGDLRRHRAHYDATVIIVIIYFTSQELFTLAGLSCALLWFDKSRFHPCNTPRLHFAGTGTALMNIGKQTASINSLHRRHNDHDSVSNHQPHGCLLNRLFRRRSKKTSKLRVTGLCVGNSPGPVNSPHKGPVPRKMFPFDDVIMYKRYSVKAKAKCVNISCFRLFITVSADVSPLNGARPLACR